MGRFVVVFLALVFGVLVYASAVPEPACAASCGLKPLKPLTPLGCNDLCASCQCDSRRI